MSVTTDEEYVEKRTVQSNRLIHAELSVVHSPLVCYLACILDCNKLFCEREKAAHFWFHVSEPVSWQE